MYNSDVTDVRKMAALGTSTQDFDDTRINEMQEMGKDIIDAKTGKSDWSSSDAQWELIKEIENLFATALILGHGGQQDKKDSETIWLRAMSLLDIVIAGMSGATGADADIIFSSSKYTSYPAGLADDANTWPHSSTRRDSFY